MFLFKTTLSSWVFFFAEEWRKRWLTQSLGDFGNKFVISHEFLAMIYYQIYHDWLPDDIGHFLSKISNSMFCTLIVVGVSSLLYDLDGMLGTFSCYFSGILDNHLKWLKLFTPARSSHSLYFCIAFYYVIIIQFENNWIGWFDDDHHRFANYTLYILLHEISNTSDNKLA